MKLILEYIDLVINEGRVDDLKRKNPDRSELIDSLSKLDPSKNNKYLAWMFKQANNGVDPELIARLVKYFHDNNKRFDKRDINSYSISDLEDMVEKLSAKKSRKSAKVEGADKIYEDDQYLILHIKNKTACMKYGSDTKWCITMKDKPYYSQYTSAGVVFFFMIDKSLNAMDPGSKIAFSVKPSYDPYNDFSLDFEVFDAQDDSVPVDEYEWQRDIIYEYMKKHVKIRTFYQILMSGDADDSAVISYFEDNATDISTQTFIALCDLYIEKLFAAVVYVVDFVKNDPTKLGIVLARCNHDQLMFIILSRLPAPVQYSAVKELVRRFKNDIDAQTWVELLNVTEGAYASAIRSIVARECNVQNVLFDLASGDADKTVRIVAMSRLTPMNAKTLLSDATDPIEKHVLQIVIAKG